MEKVLKAIRIIAVTLMVILVTVIAFVGTYAKRNNVWKNLVPEFNYGIELGGFRELRYALDTTEEEKNVYIDSEGNILGEVKEETEEETAETDVSVESATEEGAEPSNENTGNKAEENSAETEQPKETKEKPNYATEVRKIKANEDSVKTIENYKKAKKIIQNRLENEEVYEYNMRLDTVTGEIILEVPNDENVSIAHTAVTSVGNFKIIDEQTGIILMDNSHVKSVEAGTYQSETGFQTCLQIRFTKEGAEKLSEISKKYREVVNDAGESSVEYVSAVLDGQTITTTYFGEELTGGVIQIPLGEASTDSATINSTLAEARRIADVIDQEKLPIAYTLSSDILVESGITSSAIQIALIIFAIVIIAASVALIVKFKKKGAIAAILAIGFVSILNLIVRYTGLYVTLNSVIAFVSVIVLNYAFMKLLLVERNKNEIVKEAFLGTMKKYYLAIIPVCIIAIVFTFASNIVISSIGTILFWGLLLQAIYNAITVLGLGLI